MKLFTIIFVAALAGVGLGFAASVAEFGIDPPDPTLSGYRRADAIGERPRLELVESSFDFGTMHQNESNTHTFVLKNNGFGDLEIVTGQPSCKCTVSKVSQETVPPGEISEITLTWKTGSSKGKYAKWLPITTNDPAQPRARLEIRGLVIPKYDFLPPSIYASTTSESQSTEFESTLYFFLDPKAEILGFELTNEDIDEFFEIRYEPLPKDQFEGLGKDYAVRGYKIHIVTLPGMKAGPYHQSVLFNSSLKTKSPLRLTINGEVRGNIEIYGPNWNRRRSTLTFGTLKQGTSKRLPLAVSAIGKHCHDLTYQVKEVVPADLKVEIGDKRTLPDGRSVQTRVTITVPEDSAVCEFSGETDDELGRVVLATSHEEYPDVVLRIKLTVTPELAEKSDTVPTPKTSAEGTDQSENESGD